MQIHDEKQYTGYMAVMGRDGDTKYMWDANKQDEVDIARKTFESFRKKGYLAFRATGKEGAKGEQIRTFQPDAERIIFVPPMVGG